MGALALLTKPFTTPRTPASLSIIRTGVFNIVTRILKRKKIEICMTEENYCYENAMAESVNGILKEEFYLDQTLTSAVHTKKATKNAIKLYNNNRLHLSLEYKTPNYVHQYTA